MDIFHQHFNSQKNAINTLKGNIMDFMAICLKVRLESKEHKTNLDNALLVDGIKKTSI